MLDRPPRAGAAAPGRAADQCGARRSGNEPDLIAALQSRQLAGAFLDVFAHEPLPAASPLWDLPNVIVTPHTSGHSDGHFERVAQVFVDNLVRWVAGQPLANRVG